MKIPSISSPSFIALNCDGYREDPGISTRPTIGGSYLDPTWKEIRVTWSVGTAF